MVLNPVILHGGSEAGKREPSARLDLGQRKVTFTVHRVYIYVLVYMQ